MAHLSQHSPAADVQSALASTPPGRPGRGHLKAIWWQPGDGRRLSAILSAALALAALLTWLLPYVGVPMTTGPMYRGGAHGAALDEFDVGDQFTYGMNVLTLPKASNQVAVITDVDVIGIDRGVRFLGGRLGSPDRTETWQLMQAFPPRGPRHDVVPLSTPITSQSADENGWELFIGLQITKPGYWVSDGWRITYEVNGRTYQYDEHAELTICTPDALTPAGTCPFPQ